MIHGDEDDDPAEDDPAGRGHWGGSKDDHEGRGQFHLAHGGTPGRSDRSRVNGRHDDVSSEFQQKKTPGFWPGVIFLERRFGG